MKKLYKYLLLITISLSVSCSNTDKAVENGLDKINSDATLSLQVNSIDSEQVVVDLYLNTKEVNKPRMVELFFEISDNFKLKSSEPLHAITAADKNLTVQSDEQGQVRTVILSTMNTNTIDSGSLVRYTFSYDGGSGEIKFVDRRPVFAPLDADRGLTFGESLSLGGVK